MIALGEETEVGDGRPADEADAVGQQRDQYQASAVGAAEQLDVRAQALAPGLVNGQRPAMRKEARFGVCAVFGTAIGLGVLCLRGEAD